MPEIQGGHESFKQNKNSETLLTTPLFGRRANAR